MSGGRIDRQGIDVMQVCQRGHQITASLRAHPSQGKAFCPECGTRTITSCPNCSKEIRGFEWGGGFSGRVKVPKFGEACGQSYPWTASALEAVDEIIADLDDLTSEEQQRLSEAVRDLTIDGPRTELGLTRFRKLATKAGQTLGGSLYKVAIDLASEAAKKALIG